MIDAGLCLTPCSRLFEARAGEAKAEHRIAKTAASTTERASLPTFSNSLVIADAAERVYERPASEAISDREDSESAPFCQMRKRSVSSPSPDKSASAADRPVIAR
jgi:hypothetical protein